MQAKDSPQTVRQGDDAHDQVIGKVGLVLKKLGIHHNTAIDSAT